MINRVIVDTIQYENEIITVSDTNEIHDVITTGTIVKATVQLNDVMVTSEYRFNGALESREEIVEKIKELYK